MMGKKTEWTGSIIYHDRYPRPKSAKTYAANLQAALVQSKTVSSGLERRREQFAEILRPHVKPTRSGGLVLNLGDGWRRFCVADEPSESVHDAIVGMDILYLLDQPGLDSEVRFQLAFKLGYLVQFMEGVRSIEEFANSGWDSQWRRRKGGKGTRKATPEVIRRINSIFADKRLSSQSANSAAQHISGELLREGIKLGKHTVKKHMPVPVKR
jgi:hypothetical protein